MQRKISRTRKRRWDWRKLSVRERSAIVRRVRDMKKYRFLGGRHIARMFFRNISGTGLITHTWRHGPKLVRRPRARA